MCKKKWHGLEENKLCYFYIQQVSLRDAIIKENPVKSGFLQITFTPPLPPKISGTHIFSKSRFQNIPPPDFSGPNVFLPKFK